MKLKTFTAANTMGRQPKSGRPFVSFNRSTGLILFNATADTQFSLLVQNNVVFYQDESSPEDWYIEFVQSSETDGFRIRRYKKTAAANSVAICRKIIGDTSDENKSRKCPIATEPTEYEGRKLYALITSAAK